MKFALLDICGEEVEIIEGAMTPALAFKFSEKEMEELFEDLENTEGIDTAVLRLLEGMDARQIGMFAAIGLMSCYKEITEND